MNLDRKRWLMLLAGILVNICQGAAYASSVFALPLLMHLHLTKPGPTGKLGPDMAYWAAAFAWNLGFLPVGMLLAGRISDKGNPRLSIILGSVLFGLGMFLAGWANSFTWFIVTFGVMMGIGSGMAYGAVVAVAVRWFPDRRGLASGLAVSALGFGSFVIAPVADFLMKHAPVAPDVAVLYAFKVLGIAFMALMTIGSLILNNPPKDYVPSGFVAKAVAAAAAGKDFVWTELLAKPRFWLLYCVYACGAFSGLMIISAAKPIAMGNAKLLTAQATAVVAIIGLSNAAGRVLWGFVSDKIGRVASLALMFAITAATMFAMPTLASQQMTLIVGGILIGMCFGGYLGTFPSLCADAFGPKNMAVNYALLFSSFSVAAIAGPMVGGIVKNNTGSYNHAFIIAGVVAAVGLVFSLFVRTPKAKPAQ